MAVEGAWPAAGAVDRPGDRGRGKPLDSESFSHFSAFSDFGVGTSSEDELVGRREEDVGSGDEGVYSV